VVSAFNDIAIHQGTHTSGEQVAEGFLKIAVEHMAQAIKKISVERGYDVQTYALTCFGGAGGQHACLVAERLGMQKIFIHPFASILSAYGMGLADIRSQRSETFQQLMVPPIVAALSAAFSRMQTMTAAELLEQDIAASAQTHEATVFLRYAGTDTTLLINYASIESMQKEFEKYHLA
jgi:5-oxoprolinase (ATP-hydrolysing)